MIHSIRWTLIAFLSCIGMPAQQQLSVTGLHAEAPLRVAATATTTELVVHLDINADWHLYSRDTGGGQPVTLRIDDTSSFRAAGPLQTPDSEDGRITGLARISLPLNRHSEGSILKVVMEFMACDPVMCLPPMDCTLSSSSVTAAPNEKLNVLLVVRELGDRSKRIASFLQDHSHTCAVTTYDDVTAASCDRHDVILADSELFRTASPAVQAARNFPRTTTPIIAVGFLGTELIEQHGLAMTSGYI